MSAFVVIPSPNCQRTLCVDLIENQTLADLKKRLRRSRLVQDDAYFVTYRGNISTDSDPLQVNGIYYLCPRVLGGKGGFGSMLRAIGAQIEKTTNREACRDLSGRRMRDVNNEKKLKDWISKKADREREKERIRKERLARRLAVPRHNFDDPNYDHQKSKVADNLEDALQTGLQKHASKSESSSAIRKKENLGKRPARIVEDPGPSSAKASRKSFGWMGVEGASDLDSDISDSDSNDDEGITQSEGVSCIAASKSCSTPDTCSADNDEMSDEIETSVTDSGEKTYADTSSLLSVLPPPSSNSEALHPQNGACDTDPTSIDLYNFSSVEELEQLGLDTLKAVLMQRGLKCGGTLHQRAERLFSVKGLKPEEIDPSLMAKPQNGKSGKKKKC